MQMVVQLSCAAALLAPVPLLSGQRTRRCHTDVTCACADKGSILTLTSSVLLPLKCRPRAARVSGKPMSFSCCSRSVLTSTGTCRAHTGQAAAAAQLEDVAAAGGNNGGACTSVMQAGGVLGDRVLE